MDYKNVKCVVTPGCFLNVVNCEEEDMRGGSGDWERRSANGMESRGGEMTSCMIIFC